MATVIRLKRQGAKHQPTYKIVVMEKRSKATGKAIEEIGYFNNLVKPPILRIKKDRLEEWVKLGAKLSPGLKRIIAQFQYLNLNEKVS